MSAIWVLDELTALPESLSALPESADNHLHRLGKGLAKQSFAQEWGVSHLPGSSRHPSG